MKKIVPFFLFIPLIFFSIYLGFTQFKNSQKVINPVSSSLTPTNVPEGSESSPETSPTPSVLLTSQINLIISNPISGEEVNDSSISVTGTTGKNVNVIVNDQELISNSDGTFNTTIQLDEGENYISIVAYDDFGNSAEREIMVSRTISGL